MKLIAAEQKGAHSHIENKDFFFLVIIWSPK
jgi:hypothetical protein